MIIYRNRNYRIDITFVSVLQCVWVLYKNLLNWIIPIALVTFPWWFSWKIHEYSARKKIQSSYNLVWYVNRVGFLYILNSLHDFLSMIKARLIYTDILKDALWDSRVHSACIFGRNEKLSKVLMCWRRSEHIYLWEMQNTSCYFGQCPENPHGVRVFVPHGVQNLIWRHAT